MGGCLKSWCPTFSIFFPSHTQPRIAAPDLISYSMKSGLERNWLSLLWGPPRCNPITFLGFDLNFGHMNWSQLTNLAYVFRFPRAFSFTAIGMHRGGGPCVLCFCKWVWRTNLCVDGSVLIGCAGAQVGLLAWQTKVGLD